MNIEVGKVYRLTEVMKVTPVSKYQPNTEVIGNREIKTFDVKVTSVETREDYVYFGFTPLDSRVGKFGYSRLYNNYKYRPYGIIEIEEVA